MALGKLAEGEELGSNLLRVSQRTQKGKRAVPKSAGPFCNPDPSSHGHLPGG
jgi:hypothetical protein